MKVSDETKVSLITATCILALAIISKNVLRVQIDTFSLYGPVWVYIAYIISKEESKKTKEIHSALAWSSVIIIITLATIVLYSF